MSKWERGMWFTFTNSHMNLIKQHNTASTIWKRKNERRVIHNVYTRQRDREPSICSNCAQLFKLFHKFSKSLIDVSCGVVWCSAARHRNYLIVCVDQKIRRWFFPISNIEKKNEDPNRDWTRGYYMMAIILRFFMWDIEKAVENHIIYNFCSVNNAHNLFPISNRKCLQSKSNIRQKPNDKVNESHTNKRENTSLEMRVISVNAIQIRIIR